MKYFLFIWIELCLISNLSFALDQIVRPYQSTRSAALGGLRITTGLYDENFFNNPARVTANPKSKLTVFDITPLEPNGAAIGTASTLLGGGNPITTIVNNTGSNIHNRFQLIFPAYYLAAIGERKTAFAFGLITSLQVDAALRKSYQADASGILDIGPALTLGHKYLDDTLSVGLTGHLSYRLATDPNYGLLDYLTGTALTLSSSGGDGAMYDFDFGATYKFYKLGQFQLEVGAAVQNILGGTYSNLGIRILNSSTGLTLQPRSFGGGISATRSSWGVFRDTVFAIEVTDIGNNRGGGNFRLLHLGGETHWKSLIFRAGLNQGYMSGGIGLDFTYITVNLATYGEELGLNAGDLEDRRYAFNLGLHI